jgi:hypothetical protein
MAVIQLGHRVVGAIYNPSPSNASDVVQVYADLAGAGHGTWSVQSESGGVLTLRRTFDGGVTYETMGTVSAGNWAIRDQAGWNLDYTPATVARIYNQPSAVASMVVEASEFGTAVDSRINANKGREFLGTKSVVIPAAAALTPNTREVAVSWPRTLPSATYDVDINPDTVLAVGSPYTFAIKSGSKTTTGCVLQYTNPTLIVTLSAGTVDLTASR